jgi:hypothetical protein
MSEVSGDKGAIEGVMSEGLSWEKKERKEYEQVFRRGKACSLGLYTQKSIVNPLSYYIYSIMNLNTISWPW